MIRTSSGMSPDAMSAFNFVEVSTLTQNNLGDLLERRVALVDRVWAIDSAGQHHALFECPCELIELISHGSRRANVPKDKKRSEG